MSIQRAVALAALLYAMALAFSACGGSSGSNVLLPPLSSARPSASALASPSGATASPSAQPSASPGGHSPGPTAEPPSGGDDLLRVVDKQTGLPAGYVPAGLVAVPAAHMAPGYGGERFRQVALDALTRMLDAAKGQGLDIRVRSAYRSYDEQVQTYQYWVSQLGQVEADRVSAPPGHSEHQLGTAVDLTSASIGWDLVDGFANTPEGQWLAAHAFEYGFALSYPQDEEAVTGYEYEPWHFRYVGSDAAARWHASGLTLVEFLRGL